MAGRTEAAERTPTLSAFGSEGVPDRSTTTLRFTKIVRSTSRQIIDSPNTVEIPTQKWPDLINRGGQTRVRPFANLLVRLGEMDDKPGPTLQPEDAQNNAIVSIKRRRLSPFL